MDYAPIPSMSLPWGLLHHEYFTREMDEGQRKREFALPCMHMHPIHANNVHIHLV
jgi:hypothetical protein